MTTKNEKPSTISLDDVLQGTESVPEVDSDTKAIIEKLRAEKEALERQIEESKPKDISKVKDGDRILIHFVTDGFVACGQSWYRGQELAFTVGSDAYRQQQGRDGTSWLKFAGSPNEQRERYGKHYFSPGPFPGSETEASSDTPKGARKTNEAPTLPKLS